MNYNVALWLSIIVGYLFAIVVGALCTKWVVDTLWSPLLKKGSPARWSFRYTGSLVGIVERTLYLASLQFAYPEFIAIWLAMKTAGQWKEWEVGNDQATGRAFFNFFLIGTGFSLAYAYIGFMIIYCTERRNCIAAIGLPIALIIGTALFVMVIKCFQKKNKNKEVDFLS
jgi:hypothetical protein